MMQNPLGNLMVKHLCESSHYMGVPWMSFKQSQFPSIVCNSLKGKKVRTSVLSLRPVAYKNRNGQVLGAEVDVFQIVAEKMGFTPRYHWETVNNQWNATAKRRIGKFASVSYFLNNSFLYITTAIVMFAGELW